MIFVVVLLLNAAFLYRSGEGLSLESVAKKQISVFPDQLCLYESAISEQRLEHRVAAYQLQKPQIVVLGSSRANNFRSSHFNVPFMSMSRTVTSTSTLKDVGQLTFNINKPKLVILLLDPWWFWAETKRNNEQSIALRSQQTQVSDNPIQGNFFNGVSMSNTISFFDGVKLPFQWLRDEKVSFTEYISLIFKGALSEKQIDCFFGVSAHKHLRGYAADGSRYSIGVLQGVSGESEDKQFADTLSRLQERRSIFDVSKPLQKDRLREFREFLAFTKQQKVHVIAVFPPMAPTVYDAFLEAPDVFSKHQFIVEQAISSFENVFDFTNPDLLNASDCEFIDGFHPGEIANMRMLSDLAQKKGNGFLLSSLDKEYINKQLSTSSGKAYAETKFTQGEVDFLNIGCEK